MQPIQSFNGYDRPWAGGTGKNMAHVTIADGTAAGVTTTNNGDGTVTFSGAPTTTAVRYVAIGINLTAGVTYALSGRPQSADLPNDVWLGIYPLDSTSVITGTADRGSGSTYTPTEDMTVRLGARFPSGTTLDNVTFSPMLRLADTDPSFEPWENICPIYGYTAASAHVSHNSDLSDPTNYAASFGQTVYGGTLDFVTGVLTMTMAFAELTGTESYSGTTNISLSRSSVGGGKTSGAIISDRFKSGYSGSANFGSVRLSSAGAIQFSNNDLYFADAAAFKAWVAEQYAAGAPVQLCYELATPQTIQLDPQAITTFQGRNNIWASFTTNEP